MTCQSRGYPIRPDLSNRMFLVQMSNAALNFVLSTSVNIREPFSAHLKDLFDHSLRSILENSFAASLMTT